MPWVRALRNFILISHFPGRDDTATHTSTHAWAHAYALTHGLTLRRITALSYKQDYGTMSRGLIFYGVKELDTPPVILRVTLV